MTFFQKKSDFIEQVGRYFLDIYPITSNFVFVFQKKSNRKKKQKIKIYANKLCNPYFTKPG